MQSLSITQWHDWAQEGTAIPMRILISGSSMYPLIRINRDYVTIYPQEERPERGDIVLFSDPARNRYVLHRVWKIDNDRILTWGDNCLRPDGWTTPEMIWGRAILIERGKRTIKPHRKLGLLLGGSRHRIVKIRYWSQRGYRAIRRRIRRLTMLIKR